MDDGLLRNEEGRIIHGREMDRLENRKRLAECNGHDFRLTDKPPWSIDAYRCSRCGGTLDATSVRWYIDGYQHGSMAHE